LKITVLNGSPKGMTSVTMQYVHHIQKKFPQHELIIFNISNRIKKLEKDAQVFQEILDSIQSSDGILWASPVYYMLVPANYKRFIELISEKDVVHLFKNKHTAFLTTSIHSFDHTAHNYMHGICDDWDMRFAGSFSADMYDLLKDEERQRLRCFAANFFKEIEKNTLYSKSYMPITWRDFDYVSGVNESKAETGNKKILVVTDASDRQTNLDRMIERFKSSFSFEIEVVNLWDIDIKGGCLGCIQCGYDNQCVYKDKDDYIEFYNTKVKAADILVWAGTITDRYLSSRWKLFFDRSFYNGHQPSLRGKQIGFIISGPLSQISNLRQIMEAYVEGQQANLCGFATDEYGDSQGIDDLLQDLAERLVQFADSNYIKPPTFLGVGGLKIFRDDIWGRLRFPFRSDYVAYKKHGVFDFPQKKYTTRMQNAIMLLMSKVPVFRREVNKRMKDEMIKPLQKVLDD